MVVLHAFEIPPLPYSSGPCKFNNFLIVLFLIFIYGGIVASWLVLLPPDQAVRVQALSGDTVFLGKTLYFTSSSHSAFLHSGV